MIIDSTPIQLNEDWCEKNVRIQNIAKKITTTSLITIAKCGLFTRLRVRDPTKHKKQKDQNQFQFKFMSTW